jgi:hypothetical protein
MRTVIIIACLFALPCAGQINLVLNPSFEDYDTCPQEINQIEYAKYWSGIDTIDATNLDLPYCDPDYCNICAPLAAVSVPVSVFYNRYPRTGNGMVQAQQYFNGNYPNDFKHDYLQGRLSNQLVAGKTYCVAFYVVLDQEAEYACNNIGVYFDDGRIDTAINTCGLPQTQYLPQINESYIISDTTNWVKIEGNFIASGTERFITIGNFYSDANTSAETINVNGGVADEAAYLIDDVSVIESNATAQAGPNVVISAGDSAFIGPHEIALPYTWYVLGSTSPIDSGGGIWVQPTHTTSYVVAQDLCGVVTRDTVTVYVYPVGVGVINAANLVVYPNPVQDAVTVGGAGGGDIVVMDVTGREIVRRKLSTNKEAVDVSGLSSGVYLYRIEREGVMVKEGKLVKN